MVLMNGSKKARNASAISNKTSVFGIMPGLAPKQGGRTASVYRHIQKNASRPIYALNGKTPAQQKLYLQQNKLVSVNPASSGGVGKRALIMR